MCTAYLFNPCNDIALVRDTPVFTPPANAALFQQAGGALPLWIAGEDDFVLNAGHNQEPYPPSYELYGLSAATGSMIPARCTDASPWGWSRNTVRLLTDAGMSRALLPDDRCLGRHRALSHRRTALLINAALGAVIDMPMPPPASEAHDITQVQLAVDRYSGRAIIKAPYSSSGRGILDTTRMQPAMLRNSVAGLIRRQGSVIVEKRLDGICDFAMLFEARAGRVRHAGYSMFNTTAGAYTGNIMLPDEEIASRIAALTGTEPLQSVAGALPAILTRITAHDYNGYMGVDMMVYRDGNGRMLIAPCIELNLRMTMGVYARLWRCRHLDPESTATLDIRHASGVCDKAPLISGGRLVEGTQSLIPQHPAFSITVTAKRRPADM